jgi:hypothetical protein
MFAQQRVAGAVDHGRVKCDVGAHPAQPILVAHGCALLHERCTAPSLYRGAGVTGGEPSR